MHAAASSQSGTHAKQSTSKRPPVARNTSKQLMDLEELVEEEKEVRNWKGICIAVLVIVTVISFVIVAIIIVTPDEVIEKTGDKLTLEEYLEGAYVPYSIEPLWASDGKNFLYKTKDNELIYFECDYNVSSVFLDNSPFRELNTNEFFLSPDKSFILFPYHRKTIYKHERLTRHKLYNTDTRLYRELIGPHGHEFQYLTWTHSGQGLIVVQKNNIYYKKSFVDVSALQFKPITNSRDTDTIYNGVPDWLYGGEILQSDYSLWLSPDDQFLLYAEFNDSGVEHMSTVLYGDPKHKYTEARSQQYPKAGMVNPTFRLKIHNFGTNTTKVIMPPNSLSKSDYYFTSVKWRSDTSVAIVWLNRQQNVSIVTICSALTAYCYENLRVEADSGWVDTPKQLVFTQAKNAYFTIIPRKDGENGFFKHIALVDATVDIQRNNIIGKKMFITIGQMEVTEIVGYNEENETVYFLAIPYDDPKQRNLYSTTVNKDNPNFRIHRCITCSLGDECLYVDAKFGASGQYYILGCLGPSVPFYSLYESPDVFITFIEENNELQQRISTKLMPVLDYLDIPLTDDIDIMCKLILPPALNKEEVIRYNLILITNEHIEDHSVTYKFDITWGYFMSSFHGVMIATVDVRGSSGRGDNWSRSIYKNIGISDVGDIITSLRYLKALHYVNDKIAVLGKGYGGYLSTAVLSSDINDVAKCGIAITPITDFRYMDSFFAEKYHGTAESAMYKYSDIQLSRYASNMFHREFMLLHGTTDDRIHFQHSAQYMKALVASNVYHHVQIYPDKSDILGDNEIKEHVHTDIENFLLNCFGLPTRTNREIIVDADDDYEDE